MRYVTFFTLVCVLLCALYFACTNPSDSHPENISIDYLSVQSGDSLYPGAGLIVSFTGAIDTNSLEAQEIHTTYDVMYNDSTYTINLQVYKIVFAQNVQVNGQPVSVWFNPTTNELAMFRETSNQMPYGTGEGLILIQDSTEVIFKAGIAAKNGATLGTDFKLYLHRAATNHQLRAVPNPVYPRYTPNGLEYSSVYFRDLPESCMINIYDHSNLLTDTLKHNGGSSQRWDLKYMNGNYINPGIYMFEIVYSSFIVEKGVFIFPGFE